MAQGIAATSCALDPAGPSFGASVHRCASGESEAVRLDEDRRRDSGQHRPMRRAHRRRAGHTTSVANHRDRTLDGSDDSGSLSTKLCHRVWRDDAEHQHPRRPCPTPLRHPRRRRARAEGRASNYTVSHQGARWLLKVFQPEYTQKRIEQAADFVSFVVSAGYPSQEFVPSRDGARVVMLGDRAAVLILWIEGDTPEPNTVSTLDALGQVGALCAHRRELRQLMASHART